MPKRILMISDHASPLASLGGVDAGGQNVYIASIAKELAELGHSIDIFTRRDNDSVKEVEQIGPSIRVINVPAGPATAIPKEDLLPYMGAFSRFVERFARLHYYDVVHAHFWMSGLVALHLKSVLGLPFAITFHALGKVRRIHQGNDDHFPEERFRVEDAVVRRADLVLAECPQDRSDLIELYNCNPAKIAIVPCGVDQTLFFPEAKSLARQRIGVPWYGKYILQLGRLVPRKGIDTVIQSLKPLRDLHGITPTLLIVGGPERTPSPERTPEIARLMRVARDNGVSAQVQFTGGRDRDELRHYYSAADVFVTTPWYEPFGITPLEAMACNTPVIGSRVGGIKYTVIDKVTGRLVPPKDPVALADTLHDCFARPEEWSSYARVAAARIRDTFTWHHVARSLEEIFEQLSAKTPEAARLPTADAAGAGVGAR